MSASNLITQRIANGMCKRCGVNPFAEAEYLCTPCRTAELEEGKNRAANKRVFRKANSLCFQCATPIDKGHKLCARCRGIRNVVAKAHALDIKRKCVEMLGGKCIDCGFITEYVAVYDFHHPDPSEKDFNIGKILTYKWSTLVKELAKCVLLCVNCHRIRHAKGLEGGEK